MGGDGLSKNSLAARDALAAAWPRPLIAEGHAIGLATWWVHARASAVARGLPPIPRCPMDRAISNGLFDARRARRLVRGLEGAELLLAAEAEGLEKSRVSNPEPAPARISRLLIVSADGSERFYRQVSKLYMNFSNRLEVLLVDCDEAALGAAAFGQGQPTRALLIDHKDAVVRFLALLDTQIDPGEALRRS